MSEEKPSYEELQARLQQVESIIDSIKKGEVDILLGETQPLVIQLKSLTDEKERLLNENQRIAKEWEKTFNAINSTVWIIDKDQTIIRANKSLPDFGIKEVIGKKCYNVVHCSNQPIEGCPYIKAKKSLKSEIMELQLGDKWYEIKVDPFIDSNNLFQGAVHIMSDITDRIETTKELKLAKEKAEESERLKSAFLANMSHEIRTPMNGILGFLELLKEPDLSETSKTEFIKIVNKSGQRLLNTINDIIEISKIDSKQITIQKTRFSITTLLKDLIAFFQPEAHQKGLKIQTNIPENCIEIESDKVKLESVFTNLIKNAIKFTEKGFVEVDLELTNEQLLVHVKDTGTGIPEDKKERIFERFVQGDTSYSRLYEGAGLGLSITKEYLTLLNADIWFSSKKGEGTTFCVAFQLTDLKVSGESLKTEISKISQITNVQTKTILIAEDDFISFQYLSTILQGKQFDIIWAKNGEEAVELTLNKQIDLVLMDAKMPKLSGYEATIEILSKKPDLPIIIQTAFTLSGDKEKAIKCGCVDYISKPITKQILLEIINKHLK